MKNILIAVSMMVLIGCKTTEINITTTKSWEGHYYTEKDAIKSVQNMKLDKKESVWIISNKTLQTILTNVSKEK